jgi:hypothetical protein
MKPKTHRRKAKPNTQLELARLKLQTAQIQAFQAAVEANPYGYTVMPFEHYYQADNTTWGIL